MHTMEDYLNNLILYVQTNYQLSKTATEYMFFGPIRFRFLRFLPYNCLESYKDFKTFQSVLNVTSVNCYYSDYKSTTINTTGILDYSFKNETNTIHELVTPIGVIGTAGVVIDVYPEKYL
jgi:hypothetical protein